MAGPLASVSLLAPGFLGLNTQDARVGIEQGYAQKANNCVIDKGGRLASRKGFDMLTTNQGTLSSNKYIEALWEHIDPNTTKYILSAGDGKLFTGTTTLVPHTIKAANQSTTVSRTFTGNRWQFQSLAKGSGQGALNYGIATQRGNIALVWRRTSDNVSGTYIWQEIGTYGTKPSNITTFDPDCCLAAYGRVWTAGITANKHTLFYSDLLDPTDFTAGSSGVLDISSVVGNNDEIVGLAAHNGFLIIFCKDNIIVYQNPQNPAAMSLSDVVNGVGCVSRDSIESTGQDLIFLSKSGIRSLLRTIQEKSMPMRELSLNIRDDITAYIASEPEPNVIKAGYSESNAFYIILFPANNIMVIFDLRMALENGAAKTTTWSTTNGTVYKAFLQTASRDFYFGIPNGIGKYAGYLDATNTYDITYKSTFSDVGSQGQIVKKFLKRATLVVDGAGEQDFVFKYGYDYTLNPRTVTISRDLGTGVYAKYNTAGSLYNVSKFSSPGIGIHNIRIPLGGQGETFAFGLDATIDDEALSIQKIDLFLKTGKTS